MPLPTGCPTFTVTAGPDTGPGGTPVAVTLSARIVLGGNAKSITWSATGQTLSDRVEKTTSGTGKVASLTLAHPVSTGWVNGVGAQLPSPSFAYLVTRTLPDVGSVTKAIQPTAGQTVIDFDTIPDGTITAPSAAPSSIVTSVNGLTGDVLIDEVPGTVTVKAMPDGWTADQTAEIKAKLAQAIAEKKTLYFPRHPRDGWYIVNEALQVTGDVTIRGEGFHSTVALENGSNCDLFQVGWQVQRFDMHDMTLDGNRANNTAGTGVHFQDGWEGAYLGTGKLINCTIQHFFSNGIRCGTQRSTLVCDNLVSGGNGGYGIALHYASLDARISNVDFGENDLGAVYVDGSNHVFTGGQMYGTYQYIGFNPANHKGKNIIVCGPNAGIVMFHDMVIEGAGEDLIVDNVATWDAYGIAQFTDCKMGRWGQSTPFPENTNTPNSFKLYKASGRRSVQISGIVYRDPADGNRRSTALIEAPATTQVNVAGLILQPDVVEQWSVNGYDKWTGLGPTVVRVPSTEFVSPDATASQATIGWATPTLNLPDGSTTPVGVATVAIPDDWVAFHVDLLGANITSATGDVKLGVQTGFVPEVGSVMTAVTAADVTIAAGASQVSQKTRVATDVTRGTGLLKLAVFRDASAAADTLTNSYGVYAVVLTRSK